MESCTSCHLFPVCLNMLFFLSFISSGWKRHLQQKVIFRLNQEVITSCLKNANLECFHPPHMLKGLCLLDVHIAFFVDFYCLKLGNRKEHVDPFSSCSVPLQVAETPKNKRAELKQTHFTWWSHFNPNQECLCLWLRCGGTACTTKLSK